MRRIALISDIHGNLTALDTVLADITACGVDELYCLGDLVGYGPDPAGVIDHIRALAIPTIMGNYDSGVGERRGECGCYYATEQAKADGAASYAYTERLVDDEDAAWLAALPHELRFEEDGLRVLLAHGSPRKINEYLLPDRTDEQLARLARAAGADVVCVGHVHVPYHRTLPSADGTIHYVSSGSVGKPKDGDPRACWAELLIGDAGEVSALFHRVAYDIDEVATEMRNAGLPETLITALRTA
ncbi:MAG TPA: metallophosphoesterase family protein [Coriobacteriia bacterium]